jgi:SAM-dependent methyltransferase
MAIRVTHVDLGEPPDASIVGRHIDGPMAGSVVQASSVEIVGWVLGANRDVVDVVLHADERYWRSIPLDQDRPDLAAAFPEAPDAPRAGFRVRIGLRGMTRAEIGLHAKLRDGRYVYLATVGLERVMDSDGSAPVGPAGSVDLGDLRRVRPISEEWGYERGEPIDRYYIEAFLERHAQDVKGRALEILDDTYTRRFGGDRVTEAHVLDIDPANTNATIVADLADAPHVPSDHFDTVIVTQTLHLIPDIRAAIATLHRILAPGGVLLVTSPGISPIGHEQWHDDWHSSLTAPSARALFRQFFSDEDCLVESHGNVLSASAFVFGLSQQDLTPAELDVLDPFYPVTIAVRATKSDAGRHEHERHLEPG